jgi:hypothetical protein
MNAKIPTARPRPSRFWTYVMVGIVGTIIGLMIQQCAQQNASSTDPHRIEWPSSQPGAKPNQ